MEALELCLLSLVYESCPLKGNKLSCLTAMNNAPCNFSTKVVGVGGMLFKI